MSCGYCEASAVLVFKPLKKMEASMNVQGVDLSVVPQQDIVQTFRTTLSTALGVPPANIVNITVQAVDQAPGRRLQGALLGYSVKFEVVVPEKQSLRDIMVQATSLSSGSGDALQTFSQTLSQTASVDVSSMVVEVPVRPRVATVQCVLTQEGNLMTSAPMPPTAPTPTPSDTPAPAPGGAITLPECADDSAFVDEQGEGCSGWIGFDCRSTRWLKTERPYTARGLREVLTQCPLACGVCSPLLRKTPEELLETCEDDAYLMAFCLRWRGLNCSEAPRLGYSTSYSEQLLSSCPLSCGLCPAAFTCADSANFLDEQNRPCDWWAGRDCSQPTAGYTRKGILDVQAACPLSCRYCSTGENATGSNATLPVTRGWVSSDPSSCVDDSSFRIFHTFSCGDFIGKSCTYATLFLEPRWLLGPRAAMAWHTKLWDNCPVSCGRCDPPGRPSPRSLRLECEDDPAFATWCAYHWSGQACADWQLSVNLALEGDADRFNRTLFERCPSSCGLCRKPVCEPATYRDKAVHDCLECVPGSYSPVAHSGLSARRCSLARPGFMVPEAGSTEETPCLPGNYSGLRGEVICSKCAPGRYSDKKAVSACSTCHVGWFQADEGTTACRRCPLGTYSDVVGASTCEDCPRSYTTLLQASADLQECVCPAGTFRGLPPSGGCNPCPDGLDCPGGHSFLNSSEDRSPLLMPGMMSLPRDPFSVYSCAGEDVCPGERPLPYSAEDLGNVCSDGRWGERCYQCPEGFYHQDSDCSDCKEGSSLWPTLFFIGQLYATYSAYRAQACGVPPTAAFLLFFTLTDFLQVMYRLKDMQINWPPVVVVTLDFLKWFDYIGFLDGIEFHQECYFGASLMARVIRDVGLPLLPFINFGVIGIVACMVGRYLAMRVVISTVAAIYLGLFVNLSALSVQLFPSDAMPNGKRFLKAFPGVQVGSAIWIHAIPFALAATSMYCVSFLAIAVRGTLAAPRRSKDKDWVETFDFLLGDIRPDVFWWGLVDLSYKFSIAMIQALFDNVYLNLYLTMLLIVTILLIEVHAKPSVYDEVNRSSVVLKIGLLIFLMFATAFIDSTGVDLSSYNVHFGRVVLGMCCVSFAFTAYAMLRATMERLRGSQTAANVEQAMRFQMVAQRIALMPDHELLSHLDRESFVDADQEAWLAANRAVVSTFFCQQPTSTFFGQRAHRSVKYIFFDHGQARRNALDAVQRDSLAKACRGKSRVVNMMVKLSRGLQASQARGGVIHAHVRQLLQVPGGIIHAHVRNLHEGRHSASLPDSVQLHAQVHAGLSQIESGSTGIGLRLWQSAKEAAAVSSTGFLTEDMFVDELRDIAGLAEKDLRTIFQHIDIRKEGKVAASTAAEMLSLFEKYYGQWANQEVRLELGADVRNEDDHVPELPMNVRPTSSSSGIVRVLSPPIIDQADCGP